jgi:DNA-binding transcriptional LysR family regulator
MARDNINDILVFFEIARERSFTRAAAKLGMTQSALSHIIRALEARLGVRLLTRTTRSVSPTEAGERLLQNVAPRLEEIEAEIAAVGELGDKPAGTVRITAIDHVIDTILWPRLAQLLPQYPDLHLEISSDYRMVDIAAERYDIGVRFGDQVDKDMIAVRLTADVRMMIVASPGEFGAGSAETQLHHAAPVRQRRHLCMGTAQGWARSGSPGPRPGDIQQRLSNPECGVERLRHRIRAGRPGGNPCARRALDKRDGRLVPDFPRPACLLSEPPPFVARAAPGDRCDSI